MADPVTAAVLAEALREAVKKQHGFQMYQKGRASVIQNDVVCQMIDSTIQESQQWVDRWQGIIDRYDAQRREAEVDRLTAYIEADDWSRRVLMESAKVARDKGDSVNVSTYVAKARLSNHHSLRHRRQLRALGGEP